MRNNSARKMQSFLSGKEQFFVWTARVLVGAVFVFSGLVKAIDLWGTVFKFEEYFAAWQWNVPMSLIVMMAMMLCSAEFVLGMMLLLGNYRRTSVWSLVAMMLVMLPLTAYLWAENPVSDCGCFGDYLVLSNEASFAKNLIITVALLWLIGKNKKYRGLFHPYSQWICGASCFVFITLIELYGYNFQPMLDFRSFPVGTSLLCENEKNDAVDFSFVYEKAGSRRVFSIDSLPDSTWTFVERVENGQPEEMKTELSVYNSEGEDVTADVISPNGYELLVVIPQYERAALYYTSYINDLNEMMMQMDGSLVELTDRHIDSIEVAKEISLADYPIYHAESTLLKELSRGVVSLVLLHDGVIQWKRNLSSIDVESVVKSDNPKGALEHLNLDGKRLLVAGLLILAVCLVVLFLFDKFFSALFARGKKRNVENKSVYLHNEMNE